MTIKLGYCIHCGQANITCINTQKDGTMTHYSVARQGECGPLMIDDVEVPEPMHPRTPPPEQSPVESKAEAGVTRAQLQAAEDWHRDVDALMAELDSSPEEHADAGEPVAWMRYLQGDVFQCDKDHDDAFPVYARPAPADALREDHL